MFDFLKPKDVTSRNVTGELLSTLDAAAFLGGIDLSDPNMTSIITKLVSAASNIAEDLLEISFREREVIIKTEELEHHNILLPYGPVRNLSVEVLDEDGSTYIDYTDFKTVRRYPTVDFLIIQDLNNEYRITYTVGDASNIPSEVSVAISRIVVSLYNNRFAQDFQNNKEDLEAILSNYRFGA